MCDAVHTTRALSLRRSVAHVAVPRPSTTTHPRRNQWSRRRTFATQSYSATPRVGQGRRCRRGPRTHVWGRHVDCVGRLRVQVPRPTDDAQVRADSTRSAGRELRPPEHVEPVPECRDIGLCFRVGLALATPQQSYAGASASTITIQRAAGDRITASLLAKPRQIWLIGETARKIGVAQ